jgi:putative transposase
VRLHSAIGYVAPLAKLEGREAQIFAERDGKLEVARRHPNFAVRKRSSPPGASWRRLDGSVKLIPSFR